MRNKNTRARRGGRPSGASAKARAALASYQALGAMPDDPLAGAAWLGRALAQSALEVLADTALTPSRRRQELRAIARSIVPLLPASRLLEAERIVRAAMAARERREREPQMRPVDCSDAGSSEAPDDDDAGEPSAPLAPLWTPDDDMDS